MNNLQVAQGDMRSGYGYGSIGVIISGVVWIISALVVNLYSPHNGIWTLIIGGIFIFPISTLIAKLIGIKGSHDKNNPLGKLAMEGTIWMILCIPLAYGLSLMKTEWFFQAMIMIIAGRYLTFASIYGMRIYWVLAGILGLTTYVLFKLEIGAHISALTGGLVEVLFGIIIYIQYKNKREIVN